MPAYPDLGPPLKIRRMLNESPASWWLTLLVTYGLLRASDLLFLWVVARRDGVGLGRYLISWDAEWAFKAIQTGWPADPIRQPDGVLEQSTLAWPPLYPLTVRVAGMFVGESRTYLLMVVVNLAAGAVAMALIARLFMNQRSRAWGLYVAIIWASLPAAAVLVLGYAEGIFMLFIFAALLAASRNRWIVAGIAIAGAGLAKSSVAPFAAAIAVVALVAMWRTPMAWRAWLGPIIALLLSAFAVVAWPAFVASRVGQIDGYAQVQQAWGWSTVPFLDSWNTLLFAGTDPTREPYIFLGSFVVMVVAAYLMWRRSEVPLVARVSGVFVPAFWAFTGAAAVATMRFLLPNPAVSWLVASLARTWVGIAFLMLVLAVGRYLWLAVYVSWAIPYPPP